MARTLARLRARGLVRLVRRRGVHIQLTKRGDSVARQVATARGPVKQAHAIHDAGHTVVSIAL